MTTDRDTELVERLRDIDNTECEFTLCCEAADTIESQASLIREAVEVLEHAQGGLSCPTCADWCDLNPACQEIDAFLRQLKGKLL